MAAAAEEVAITDEVDTVEKPIDGWHIFGTECPKCGSTVVSSR